MAITIHGSATSTCTQRVLTTCLELGIPYTLHVLDFAAREHKTEAFMKLQPWGKVPVLEDDGVFIFESRAICKYLVAKHTATTKSTLMPDTEALMAYGLFEQGCSIELSYFNPPVEGIVYEKLFKAWQGAGDTDEVAVASFVSQLDATLKAYDSMLAKQKYVGGNEFTLADIYHLPYGTKAISVGFSSTFEKYPNVWDWWQRCSKRDS
ncbi:putative glutathione S-transferase [Xylogone sp. PMI_703]|nr:putative glutathione S-transferase [Xylogone sp. PMI_703]